MREASLRNACQPGCLSAPTTVGRLVSTRWAVIDAYFLPIRKLLLVLRRLASATSYGTVSYGTVARPKGPIVSHCQRLAELTTIRSGMPTPGSHTRLGRSPGRRQ